MRLADFNALCNREWARGKGDVTALSLTDASYRELNADLAAGPQLGTFSQDGTLVPVNPATRTVVGLAGGSLQDTAEIRYGPGGPVKTVPVARAARVARAVQVIAALTEAQHRNADELREAIHAARADGVTWQDIGEATGIPRETVFRQFSAGSPIVVVKARHASDPRSGRRGTLRRGTLKEPGEGGSKQ